MNERSKEEAVRELRRAAKAYAMLLPVHAKQLEEMERYGKISPETQAKAREAAQYAHQIDAMIDRFYS